MPRTKSTELNKSRSLTIRLTDEQWSLLQEATKKTPYRISLTDIVVRGIELASKELGNMSGMAQP